MTRLIAVAITLTALGVIYRRFRTGSLLTAVTGLHVNMLLFMGIGPLLYSFTPDLAERVPYPEVVAGLAGVFPFALAGYGITVLLDLWTLHRFSRKRRQDDVTGFSLLAVTTFGILAVIGASLAGSEFSNAGVGTLFPVLRGFLYPALLMAVVSYRPSFAWNLITGSLSIFAGISAFLSPWRSGLTMFVVTVSLIVVVRPSKRSWLLIPAIAFVMYVIMPFQIIKRENFEAFSDSGAADTIMATYALSWSERNQMVSEFISMRINTAREMGYVQSAINNNTIDLRGGDSYLEAIKQLVPRTIWTGKPSFGDWSGFVFPRLIGLLDVNDAVTSWGVGLWAEAVWNYSYQWLIMFVPAIFSLTFCVDVLIARVIKQQTCLWMARAGYFFLFLSIVSIVFSMTYILWLFIIVLIADRVFRFPQPESPDETLGIPDASLAVRRS